jgi:hypothetical protein
MINDLTEMQVQDIAEDYLQVMIHMGEFVIDLDETLEQVKEMIRMNRNPKQLVNMMRSYRSLNDMDPYQYTEPIKLR